MTRKARKAQPKGPAAAERGRSASEPTTFAQAFARLTPQRRAFVASYLERPNATRAAKAANYSEKTARSQGQRLLTSADVKTALRLGWAEAGMGAEEVRARTEEVARTTLEDFFSFERQEHRPYTYRPVAELLTELFAQIDFEERFAQRAGLSGKELKAHAAAQLQRRRDATRMELEMEADPYATRWVPGPPVLREVPRLDLAKARDLGVLHLAKKIKPTPNGLALELQDPEQARVLIGRLHGLWAKDDDAPSTDDGLPEGTGLEDASDEQLAAELTRLLGQGAG
ncbi:MULTISPECIES: terminase small subunit [Deinococcus]|uniref:Terminase small subunit n=1 Tax=Deinococcus rufus TaxID=2136097 RepID=A0ABV7ZCN8_9DEIO|nr:terminase small subunit [Deinococcus sp. AB2017081]WQE94057.1 terminase small subunit [Deinococcus sp. AB2017081]